jgi:hypothetical protein
MFGCNALACIDIAFAFVIAEIAMSNEDMNKEVILIYFSRTYSYNWAK